MSESLAFSVYEFDFNIMLLLSFIGIFIKLMFEFGDFNTGGSSKASAAIIGYTLVIISISSLLFVQLSLAKIQDMKEPSAYKFIANLISGAVPPLLLLLIIIWLLYININYFDRINSGTLTEQYKDVSFISSMMVLLQIAIVFKYFSKNSSPIIDDGGDSALKALEQNITSLSYLLTLANVMFIGIINIILEYFATDG
jgi:hypothetical protein|tara:strand:- start:237 stop:830 length:594 start_codon:yes stop_codon:yes gene_type:complete